MHPILFKFGFFTLYSYGLFVAIGFLVASFLALRDFEKVGYSKDVVVDCIFMVLLGGIIGGRLLFVMLNLAYYIEHPIKIIMINEGGLAFQGGLVCAVFFGIWITKKKNISFLKSADIISPYIALGHCFGRIGCFFNGCCYGKVICSGLGVVFPGENVMRVPSQLFESFFLLILFVLLLSFRNKKSFDGQIFVLYFIFYSFFRFFLDFLRDDVINVFIGLKLSQFIGIVIFCIGIIFFIILKNRYGKTKF